MHCSMQRTEIANTDIQKLTDRLRLLKHVQSYRPICIRTQNA